MPVTSQEPIEQAERKFLSFRRHHTSTRQTSGNGLPEKRKISGGGM
jgi:hypothetical protein